MKTSYDLPEICTIRKKELIDLLRCFLNDYEDIFNENLITPISFTRLLHDALSYDRDEIFYEQNRFGVQNVVTYSVYYTSSPDLSINDGEGQDIQFPIIRIEKIWCNEKYKNVLPERRDLVIVNPEILKNICMLFMIEGHTKLQIDVTDPKEIGKYLENLHLKAIEKYRCTLNLLNSCATQYNLEQMTKKN